jgi:hypothetical protein
MLFPVQMAHLSTQHSLQLQYLRKMWLCDSSKDNIPACISGCYSLGVQLFTVVCRQLFYPTPMCMIFIYGGP